MATNQVISRLKAQLLNSGLQQKDNPLFQVINQLIDYVSSNSTFLSILNGPLGLKDHNHTSLPGDGGILTNDEHDGYSDYESITDPGIPDIGHKRLWNNDIAGKLFFTARDSDGTDLVLARDNVIIVRNVTGGTLTKGQAVYFDGGATGNFPHVSLAQANDESTMPAIGLLFENINNNNFGRVMVWGRLSNFNTSSFTEGDLVYIDEFTPGAITTVIPTGPISLIQRIGVIAISGVGNGAVLVTQTSIRQPRNLIGPIGPLPTDHCCEQHDNIPFGPLNSLLPWISVLATDLSFTASAGTWTIGTVSYFKYAIIGRLVFIKCAITGTSVSSTPIELRVSLTGIPILLKGNDSFGFSVYTEDNFATQDVGQSILRVSTNALTFKTRTSAAWTATTGTTGIITNLIGEL